MGRLIDVDKLNRKDVNCANVPMNFIDTALTVEAIPKAEYKTRLKADMVAMLEELKKEMNPIKDCEYQIYGKEHWGFVGRCQDVIQQKIDKLKGASDGN